MDPADVFRAAFPVLENGTLSSAGSEVRYCLYEGLGGYGDHVSKHQYMATISAADFMEVLEFARPRAEPGVYWYEAFYYRNATSGETPIHDLNCGTGAFAVLDLVNRTLGYDLAVPLDSVRMTTAELLLTEVEEVTVDVNNVTDPDVIAFYTGISKIETMKFGVFTALPDFLSSWDRPHWYIHKRTDRDHFFRVRSRWPHVHTKHVLRPDWNAPHGPRGARDQAAANPAATAQGSRAPEAPGVVIV